MGLYDWTKSDALFQQQVRHYGNNQPYLRAGVRAPQSGNYSPVKQTQLGKGGDILPIATPKKGANAVSINDAGFSYVAQSPFVDTVTLYWDGTNGSKVPTLHRTDGTSQPIPAGNVPIKGLAASTTYYVLPYWSAQNPCSLGWAIGTVGSPMICFKDTTSVTALVQQSLIDNEALTSGYASFVTPAGGGSGGGGTGGGGYKPCVMLGTDIEPVDGAEYKEELSPCTEWWHLVARRGASLFCTPDHGIYDCHGYRHEAQEYKVGDWVNMRYGDDEIIVSEPHRRVCTRVRVVMTRVHMFWANNFTCANYKPNSN